MCSTDIEFSTDGITYSKATTINAIGTSNTEVSYSFRFRMLKEIGHLEKL